METKSLEKKLTVTKRYFTKQKRREAGEDERMDGKTKISLTELSLY